MDERIIRIAGLAVTVGYAALIGWLFATQPRTVAEARVGAAATLGTYSVDAQAFADGLAFFRNDQFVEARAAFARADPARRDAQTQFYVAYSFYRQGWHRTHRDNALYTQGLEAVDRAIAVAAAGRIVVDDPDLQMQTADELRAELESGLTRSLSDFNPLRLLESRK